MANDQQDESLERIKGKTGISLYELRSALGLPVADLCSATTLEEAFNAYQKAKGCSDEELAALLKMDEFAHIATGTLTTFEEARIAVAFVLHTRESGQALFRCGLNLASTAKEVGELLDQLDSYERSPAIQEALLKFEKLSLAEADNCRTYAQATEIMVQALDGSEGQRLALQKMIKFAGDFDEALGVFRDSAFGTHERRAALRIMLAFLPSSTV